MPATGGYAYCERLGLTPDLFIGDFDSYSGAVAPGVAVERLIPEKDDTDTGHAITYALAHGFRTLVLTCARWAGGWITRWPISRTQRTPPYRARP